MKINKTSEEILSIICGASFGSLCRWFTVESSLFKSKQYLGILFVNGVGSIILGGLNGYYSKRIANKNLSLL